MSGKVGRPETLQHEKIHAAILQHKDSLVIKNAALISKTDPAWETLGELLGRSGLSMYSYVANNRKGIKDLLIPKAESDSDTTIEDASLNVSNESTVDSLVKLYFSQTQFQDLVVQKQFARTEKNRPKLETRDYWLLTEEFVTELTKKLDNHGIRCGFMVKKNRIYPSANSALFEGCCKCGSTLRAEILDLTEEVVVLHCYITEGKGEGCTKLYLRGRRRTAIAQELLDTGKVASVYRIEEGGKRMKKGQKQEPAFLPSRVVLNQAKCEENQKAALDPNPATALEILKFHQLKSSIHKVVLVPFAVHYWTSSQVDVYRMYAKANAHPTVYIDATGGVVKPFRRSDKSKTGVMFLYNCVVNTGKKEEVNQFSVAQMISESHTTISILTWLLEWLGSGVPLPKEVVCDSAQALLNAVVRACMGFKSLREYANHCFDLIKMPSCYVRIDVAHIMHTFARFFGAGTTRGVKNLYLGALGKLILSRTLNEAGSLLRLILVVARNPYLGENDDGELLDSSKAKDEQKAMLIKGSEQNIGVYLTENEDVNTILQDLQKGTPPEDDVEIEKDMKDKEAVEDVVSPYLEWATDIDNSVKAAIADRGEDVNGYHNNSFADKLVRQCATLPIWSCVNRNRFGYGRVPASSAPVESDFNDLKNRAFKGKLPKRVDVFVEKHIKYIQGRDKIIEANRSPNNQEAQLKCVACIKGDFPQGAHRCAVCSKNVHALEGCSVPYGEEEGYGKKRLCLACKDIDKQSVEDIVVAGQRENWRGLVRDTPSIRLERSAAPRAESPTELLEEELSAYSGVFAGSPEPREDRSLGSLADPTPDDSRAESSKLRTPESSLEQPGEPTRQPSNKRAKHVRGMYTENDFQTHGKLKNIPILRNGDTLDLKPVRIENAYYTVIHTCAFDSVFHLFLVTEMDHHFLNDFVQHVQDDSFFDMLSEASRSGISATSYRSRATLLRDDDSLSTTIHLTDDLQQITCTQDVRLVASRVFAKIPSLTVQTSCDENCSQYSTSYSVVQIDAATLKQTGSNVLQLDVSHIVNCPETAYCLNDECSSSAKTKITETGKFVILQVSTESYRGKSVGLKKIAEQLRFVGVDHTYRLQGVVHYEPPKGNRMFTDSAGHHVSYSKRINNVWVEIQDTSKKTHNIYKNLTVNPELILYMR